MTSGWEGPRSDTLHCVAFFFLFVFAVLTSLFPLFFSSCFLISFHPPLSYSPFYSFLFSPVHPSSLFLFIFILFLFPFLFFGFLFLTLPCFLSRYCFLFNFHLFSFLFLHFFSSSILSISFPCFLLTPFSPLLVCFPLFFSFYLISLPLLSMTSFLLFHPFFISCFLSPFSLLYCPFSFPCSLQFLPLCSSNHLLSPCFNLVSPLLAPLSPSACV